MTGGLNIISRLKIYDILIIIIVALSACESDSESPDSIYHTPYGLTEYLQKINADFPDITYLEPVGTSVNGNTIHALTLSDNPTVSEGEPKVRITGAIHGDENATTEVILRLIDYLTSGYKSGIQEIKNRVDSRYIVFIPMMNPDGVEFGTRYNKNDVDLNRNFSTMWIPGYTHGLSAFSEPESDAVREYSLFTGFHISLTLHMGAVIVNMPFDYASYHSSGIRPDEHLLVSHLGEAYAASGRFLETEGLLNTPYVVNGTINGGDWFVISGSLQDWSYLESGCIDYTVEISLDKKPGTPEEINELFELNRDSAIGFIDAAGMGLYGRITDAGGAPLEAVITVAGGDIVTRSDGAGYYHRVLLPGDYAVTFTAGGYTSNVTAVTIPPDPGSLLKDIVMTP